MTILAVDPGEKKIGLALSDPTNQIATPHRVLEHVAREIDAAKIAEIAQQQAAELILIGQSLDDEGNLSPSGRKAARLAEAIQNYTALPIQFWDESFTTQDARSIRLQSGASKKRRRGHLDDVAAAVLLQSYLDANTEYPKK